MHRHLFWLTLAVVPACGNDAVPFPTREVEEGVTHPDAPPLPGETECRVKVRTGITVPPASHVPVCTPVTYPTDPPSGGNHWPLWARYGQHAGHVPLEMLVHNLEHGSIVFLYRCGDERCDDLADDFASLLADDVPADPLCVTQGLPTRTVVAPARELVAPIAAAAWGATYEATCFDPESLLAFHRDHYGLGPESVCSDGIDPFAEGSMVLACADF